ncbi:hypothetical protein [Streptomyces sp. NPDC002599]|uniref:hypothetical protein n=1 Tax=Streptomyces sp. NPDC002599 TaxID=3154421 RepID=UPI00331C740D
MFNKKRIALRCVPRQKAEHASVTHCPVRYVGTSYSSHLRTRKYDGQAGMSRIETATQIMRLIAAIGGVVTLAIPLIIKLL